MNCFDKFLKNIAFFLVNVYFFMFHPLVKLYIKIKFRIKKYKLKRKLKHYKKCIINYYNKFVYLVTGKTKREYIMLSEEEETDIDKSNVESINEKQTVINNTDKDNENNIVSDNTTQNTISQYDLHNRYKEVIKVIVDDLCKTTIDNINKSEQATKHNYLKDCLEVCEEDNNKEINIKIPSDKVYIEINNNDNTVSIR